MKRLFNFESVFYLSLLSAAFSISAAALNQAEILTENPNGLINFEKLIKNTNVDPKVSLRKEIDHSGITVIKFSAKWCSPCKKYMPVFEETASLFKVVTASGNKVNVKYIAIDIDVYNTIAKEFSISRIPATIIFKNGKQVDYKEGIIAKDVLIKRIQELAK